MTLLTNDRSSRLDPGRSSMLPGAWSGSDVMCEPGALVDEVSRRVGMAKDTSDGWIATYRVRAHYVGWVWLTLAEVDGLVERGGPGDKPRGDGAGDERRRGVPPSDGGRT